MQLHRCIVARNHVNRQIKTSVINRHMLGSSITIAQHQKPLYCQRHWHNCAQTMWSIIRFLFI